MSHLRRLFVCAGLGVSILGSVGSVGYGFAELTRSQTRRTATGYATADDAEIDTDGVDDPEIDADPEIDDAEIDADPEIDDVAVEQEDGSQNVDQWAGGDATEIKRTGGISPLVYRRGIEPGLMNPKTEIGRAVVGMARDKPERLSEVLAAQEREREGNMSTIMTEFEVYAEQGARIKTSDLDSRVAAGFVTRHAMLLTCPGYRECIDPTSLDSDSVLAQAIIIEARKDSNVFYWLVGSIINRKNRDKEYEIPKWMWEIGKKDDNIPQWVRESSDPEVRGRYGLPSGPQG